MRKITYELFNTSPYLTSVFLDGKHVGNIRAVGGGYAYYPRNGRGSHGEVFPTPEQVKETL